MKSSPRSILISLALMITVGIVVGQDNQSNESSFEFSLEEKQEGADSIFQLFLAAEVNHKLDSANAAYDLFSLDHRRRALKWQYVSSIMIFFIVISIVLTGLMLSYLHFRHSMKTNEHSETELEVSQTGFKVRSSVIGIIILVVSIAFFYLYLAHVYEITEINPSMDNTEATRD